MQKKTEHTTQIQKGSITGLAIYADEKISKSNCKVCQCEVRKEAEEEYERTGSLRAAHLLLKGKNVEVSYLSVRNHLHRHYLGESRRTSILEWGEDVNKFASSNTDKKSMILERIAILRREMFLIASESDGCAMEERRKNADVIKKLSDGIGTLEDKLDKEGEEYEKMEILVENLKNLLANKIKSAKNEDIKRAFMDMLQELSDNVNKIISEDNSEE